MSDTDTPTNVSDASQRAIDLARVIDRLPPGKSVIVIDKPDIRAGEWDVEVFNVHHNRSMRLPKRPNGSVP